MQDWHDMLPPAPDGYRLTLVWWSALAASILLP